MQETYNSFWRWMTSLHSTSMETDTDDAHNQYVWTQHYARCYWLTAVVLIFLHCKNNVKTTKKKPLKNLLLCKNFNLLPETVLRLRSDSGIRVQDSAVWGWPVVVSSSPQNAACPKAWKGTAVPCTWSLSKHLNPLEQSLKTKSKKPIFLWIFYLSTMKSLIKKCLFQDCKMKKICNAI